MAKCASTRQIMLFAVLAAFLAGMPSSLLAQSKFVPEATKKVTDIDPAEVIHFTASSAQSFPDNKVEVTLNLKTEQEFSLYIDKVSFRGPAGFDLKNYTAPGQEKLIDPITNKEVEVFTAGEFSLQFEGKAPFKEKEFPVTISFTACSSRICLFPYTQTLHVSLIPGQGIKRVVAPITPESTTSPSKESFEEEMATKLKHGDFSLLMLFVIVFLGGLLTNLTPCVAPMIPITLRLLGKQTHSPLVNSSLYASGILVTYTLLGIAASASGTAFGTFMSSVPLNLVFAVLMALLGMTMIGFGNLSSLQAIGSRIGAGKPSARNTFLMGAAAGLVAAPCTGPILGALLAYTAGKQDPMQGMLLMFTYSLGFSIPYIFLGGLATQTTRIKVSPRLQVGIKMVFAGVMFGLSLYYLRIPFYNLLQTLKPHFHTLWKIGIIAGSALAILWSSMPKAQNNKFLLLIPSLLLGMGLFAGSQWLTSTDETSNAITGFPMLRSEAEALAAANTSRKPILIDNWAEWCEACKKMDVTTFRDPAVIEELKSKWIVLKMDLTKSTEADEAHLARYEIQGLPTLILLPPNGDLTKRESIVGYVGAPGLLKQLHAFHP